MSRDEIIAAMARTLFVCAWTHGVEAGEIAGEGPGAGGDWMDAAPKTKGDCPDCGGRGRFGASGLAPMPGTRAAMRDPGPLVICPYCHGSGNVEVPDPDALAEARRIADAFDARARKELELLAAIGAGREPSDSVSLIEVAAELHAELTGMDRFAHCLAMQTLGHGVGLEDDLPSGVKLPGWIRASVPSSDFGVFDLDPERYPPPAEETADEDDAEVTLDPDELEALPTLAVGQTADLKVDTGTVRVWLSRCGPEDGETEPVQVERLVDGRWEEV